MKIVILTLFLLLYACNFYCCNGELVAGAAKNLVSVCIGAPVTLNVETSEKDSKGVIIWKFKDSFLSNRADYSISRSGRTLSIANALPFHSGIYIAHVDNKRQARKVTFRVSVADIYLRTQPSHVIIRRGGRKLLKVERSPHAGSLFWFFRGERLHADSQSSHYWFQNSATGAKEQLMIVNMQKAQQGLYEVVLKDEGCEVRNVVEVKLQGAKNSKETETRESQSRMTSVVVVTTLLPSLALVVGVSLFIYLRRLRRKEKKQHIAQMLMRNQILEEEDIYGQGTVYMDMSVLQGLEQQTLDSDLDSDSVSESESGSLSENELDRLVSQPQDTQANVPASVQAAMADEDTNGQQVPALLSHVQSDVDTTDISGQTPHDSQSDPREYYGMASSSESNDGIASPLQQAEDTELADSS